ncbi:MAG: DDE-type integrase/transposase/recombinase [Gammaproteobacteria bacterium]
MGAPNAVWSADFKGPFRTGDRRYCYPLTVLDGFSRYLLLCRGLLNTPTEEVRPWFVRAFRRYGLPLAIRTDNGPPFASVALGGLSALSLWWVKLGILPERISPGHPEQNGRHERMHLTLKQHCPLRLPLPARPAHRPAPPAASRHSPVARRRRGIGAPGCARTLPPGSESPAQNRRSASFPGSAATATRRGPPP